MTKIPISKICIVLLGVAALWWLCKLQIWREKRIIYSDVFSYYAYLPAAFIQKDISLKFLDYDKKSYFNELWYSTAPNGNRFMKMTMGLSVLYAPFFFAAHFLAPYFDFVQDGFSLPYQIALCLSGLVYTLLGLFFLQKILLRFFSEIVTTATILSIALGTNLYCYTTIEPAMSHSFNFFLFSAFLFYTLQWHDKPALKNSFFLGIISGLIILVRPSNALVLLIPVFYKVNSLISIKEKFHFFLIQQHKLLAFIALLIFIVLFPQMLYWKKICGSFVYYSYQDEHFFFSNPHIIEGLFGYRKGWLLYTPLMLIALTGFIFLRKKIHEMFLPLLIFTIANIYVILSWWCWWYGGSFGGRTFIESYAFLALPLAAFYDYSIKKIYLAIPVALLAIFFVWLNIFQTFQYHITLVHWDSMTKEAYWKVFGKKQFPEHFEELLKTPDYDNAKKGLSENL